MALSWSTVVLVLVWVGANSVTDADIRDFITQWPNCPYLQDKFRDDLKLEFLLKLFSHDSLKNKLASLKYECSAEGMAGLMIRDPALREGRPRDGKGYLFRTTFTRPEGSESEKDIMDLAARTVKDAVGKKGSASEFGCNYGKKDGEHVVVCVFLR
ncbi:unnamed protein product [Heligmosomoides polygyrus]|uniref:SCP domain-containing protein n=1 Tax=Heligmosomoides polygyrus TaxID=6339 RepID=A0A183GGP9_HELPZ|nr:unnamed protein product [Heligmosomoides polygyrus]